MKVGLENSTLVPLLNETLWFLKPGFLPRERYMSTQFTRLVKITHKFRFLKNKNNPEASTRAIRTSSIGNIILAKNPDGPVKGILSTRASQYIPSKFGRQLQ